MIVRISTTVHAAILAHAAGSPDAETCGLLFGAADRVEAARATTNVASDPARRFELDPQALFAAIRAERAGGPRLIGHYHSHPSGDTRPSACDAAAAEPGRLWLIAGAGHVAAWRAQAGGPVHRAFAPLGLIIV